jgi:Spy/CpxP family protein refolding chaperone
LSANAALSGYPTSEGKTVLRSKTAGYAIAAAVALCATASVAQTTPGQTDPTPPNPQAKPGATIVINPTEDECQKGWNSSLKWTKEQFDQFCTRLKAAK